MLDNEEYAHGRRRSVDVGGLALALENQGLGHGWGGWDQVRQGETRCVHILITLSLPNAPLQLRRIALRNVYPDTDNRHPPRYRSVRFPLPLPLLIPADISSRFPIKIPPETRTRLIRGLDSWHFEPHKLPDDEALFCAQILFEGLFQMENMQNDTGVSLSQSAICLVTFHVPPHALMTQMTYPSS